MSVLILQSIPERMQLHVSIHSPSTPSPCQQAQNPPMIPVSHSIDSFDLLVSSTHNQPPTTQLSVTAYSRTCLSPRYIFERVWLHTVGRQHDLGDARRLPLENDLKWAKNRACGAAVLSWSVPSIIRNPFPVLRQESIKLKSTH